MGFSCPNCKYSRHVKCEFERQSSSLVHLATIPLDLGALEEEPLSAAADREQRTSQRAQSPSCGQEILCDRLPSSSFARQA
ncbi:unnamed protein product [Coccothraustes coccothraustes]